MLIFRTLGRSEQNYNLEVVMHLAVFTLSLNVTHKRVGKGFVGIGCVFCSAVQVSPHSSKMVRVTESFCKPLVTPVLAMALSLSWLFEISLSN